MGTIINIAEWFGGKKEPWRKLADKQRVECVDEDTGEVIDIRPQQDDPTDIEGLLIKFAYVDAGGNKSERVVLCHQCWVDDRFLYVRGMCSMREALRTFRVDRMTALAEVRSGKVIDDPIKYFLAFAGSDADAAGLVITAQGVMFQPRSRESIEVEAFQRHQNTLARRACIAGLRVLAYIALADAIRSEEERNVEISYIESRLAMCGFAHDHERTEAMVMVAAGLAVPPGSLTKAVNEIAKDKDYFGLVLSAADVLSHLDGVIHKDEAVAVQKLRAAGQAKGWF